MDNGVIITLVLQSIAFVFALVRMFTEMKIKLRELDLRVRTLEKKEDVIEDKFEKIMDAINDIKLQLKDKLDRV